jgi:DNA-binding CsgD family transcriptional regulator
MLTEREQEILRLLSEGYSCSEMALKLNISETTVISHKNSIRIKLKAKNSCQVIMNAVAQGYLIPKKSSKMRIDK